MHFHSSLGCRRPPALDDVSQLADTRRPVDLGMRRRRNARRDRNDPKICAACGGTIAAHGDSRGGAHDCTFDAALGRLFSRVSSRSPIFVGLRKHARVSGVSFFDRHEFVVNRSASTSTLAQRIIHRSGWRDSRHLRCTGMVVFHQLDKTINVSLEGRTDMANNNLLINVDIGEVRVALIEDGVLGELYVERRRDRSPVGNVYQGKVTRVLPGMQAAFVDIGLDRAAFLHVEDLISTGDADELADASNDEASGKGNRLSRKTPIRDVLKEGQSIVVQVSKGPISTKGARVTGHVALPGRYVVYMPTLNHVGVSKRIGKDHERKRLKEVIESIKPPSGGVVVRTLAQGLTKKKLKADIGYLVTVWQTAQEKLAAAKNAKSPRLIHEEPDIILRAARDMFTEDVKEIVIDDLDEFARLKEFLQLFLPERVHDVRLVDGYEPLFDEYGIEGEIQRALARKVPLPSGGYLVIDQAEALTAIDVNTGRFTGKGKDVEQTIFQTNLEAVKEIAYQLRFRNIGGLIVLDFIDMERMSHRDKVYKALLEVLKKDKAKTTAVRISELGLVEMTRKRTRESLGRTLFEPCFYCDGTGHLLSKISVCHEVFRQISREKDSLPGYQITISAHPAVCDVLEREEKHALEEAGRRLQRRIVIQPRKDYHLEQFDLTAG